VAILRLDIVTAERAVYSDEVDMVIAPGVLGQLGILPHHAPLMTMLEPGELIAKKGSDEFGLVVSGGFLEVRPDRVIVLADTAERVEEIDIARAEEAMRRAEKHLAEKYVPEVDAARAEAALRRSSIRLRVARRRRERRPEI
jgi:F-type H+-transporting ATPase subunit epsilon